MHRFLRNQFFFLLLIHSVYFRVQSWVRSFLLEMRLLCSDLFTFTWAALGLHKCSVLSTLWTPLTWLLPRSLCKHRKNPVNEAWWPLITELLTMNATVPESCVRKGYKKAAWWWQRSHSSFLHPSLIKLQNELPFLILLSRYYLPSSGE